MSSIPSRLQPLLWSSRLENVDLDKDATAVIHKVLSYGDLEDIQWLFSEYGRKKISSCFRSHPMRFYTPSGFNFVRDILLDISEGSIDSSNYVKTLY